MELLIADLISIIYITSSYNNLQVLSLISNQAPFSFTKWIFCLVSFRFCPIVPHEKQTKRKLPWI